MSPIMRPLKILLILISAVGPLTSFPHAAVSFEAEIRPILESNCLRCHNSNSKKGDLSLSTKKEARETFPDLWTPKAPDDSRIIQVLLPGKSAQPEMPQNGAPLSEAQIERIRQWIREGANWPSHLVLQEPSKANAQWWAYQPISPRDPRNIDAYIDEVLSENGLTQNPPADRRTLIRRASYDLTGLPPKPGEVAAFVNDPDPLAYERLLDRLLASPQYGERWGRHWLDVVRFGESNGYERNVIINDLWPFRDYVIGSLNADKPFDQFIREHIAGDVLGKGQPEVEIGSAFLVAGPFDDVGNQDAVQAAQIRANTLDEMIRATSEAFLGLTVGCARCHNHKFDPILQADYYRLYATFAGIRHGSADWATPREKQVREQRLKPLNKEAQSIKESIEKVEAAILDRGEQRAAEIEARWVRPKIERTGVEERFPAVTARFVRLVSEGQDTNPQNLRNFNVDEFEVWSPSPNPINIALASNGTKASGTSRQIEDFADAYDADLAIDGQFGARFIATGGTLTLEFSSSKSFDRIYFSSARGAEIPTQGKFNFLGEYRIEISDNGIDWRKLTDSHDRKPVSKAYREQRIRRLIRTDEEQQRLKTLREQARKVQRQIQAIPPLAKAFLGRRSESDGAGPFHLFQGGNPQRKGEEIVPASLSVLASSTPPYELRNGVPEGQRRAALAHWITHPQNPLPARVLVNRVWHYHFGTGIVDTPSDFGYMGGQPTHPELLDHLAQRLIESNWRLKPLHREIMRSKAYRQSSAWTKAGGQLDADSRFLWRFPPRRLSAEEIRDTILQLSGQLDLAAGGPGFRLYRFMQDNVCTYEPLDIHPPDTYRRAVYHQNARASVVDLMTDFDLPDCAFSSPRRAGTTTPLQALTLLNHQFTLDMAKALAGRLLRQTLTQGQVEEAFQLAFQRPPRPMEMEASIAMIEKHGLEAFSRALLNANELIYLD